MRENIDRSRAEEDGTEINHYNMNVGLRENNAQSVVSRYGNGAVETKSSGCHRNDNVGKPGEKELK